MYNDIIIEYFVDNYYNLTIKTGYILKHFIDKCSSASFVMKTDDDMFINTPLIQKLLENISQNNQNEKISIGKEIKHGKPNRDPESKWYLPRWLFPEDYLPSYLSGTGYILSRMKI